MKTILFIISVVVAFNAFAQTVQLRKLRHETFELKAWPEKSDSPRKLILGNPKGDNVAITLENNTVTALIHDATTGIDQTIKSEFDPAHAPIIIRRHGQWLEILSNTKTIATTISYVNLKGDATCNQIGEKPAFTNTEYQRLEPFAFGDDFMRTEEEAKQWGVWQPISGNWKIHSVMERIHANPAANIREGYIPVPDRSPNPFCLSGNAPEGEALIVTGYPFWTNYEASITMKPFIGSTAALVFAFRDKDNFSRIQWTLDSFSINPTQIALIHRVDGKDLPPQETREIPARAETWYKLAVKFQPKYLHVIVDGTPLLTAAHSLAGGKVGLMAKGVSDTFFDDLDVHTIQETPLLDSILADAVQQNPQAANAWKATDSKLVANPQKNATATLKLGRESWKPQRIAVSIPFKKAQGQQGIAFGKDLAWRAIWQDQTVKLIHQDKTIQQIPCPGNSKKPLDLALDNTEPGIVTVWTNGSLAIRNPIEKEHQAGSLALIAQDKNVEFQNIVLFQKLNRDWELPVDISRFANDPYMQGWASTRYAWIKLGDKTNNDFPQKRLFNGDIYGAFSLDFPLQNNLNILFGHDEPTSENAYCLKSSVNPETLDGTIELLKQGTSIAKATFKAKQKAVIPGVQIIDEKIGARPRTPDTNTYGKLALRRDGFVIWATLDEQPLFNVQDLKPMMGRALIAEIPEQMDFIHLEIKREKCRDYLFEKAEADWFQVGRWEVTNRFACDPRWSHLNGESMGVAALWSKFVVDGDYTIECFAGMRMRQGELLEGARLSYPRVGDINVALDADGYELFSGYNLILVAWDQEWSEKWTQFWRKGKVVNQTDVELIPRGRYRAPGSRAIEVDYDPGGRPVHGAWYALKIRKSGDRFDVWFDNVHILDFIEKDSLKAGQRLALWTQHNSIVLARMKVNYTLLTPKFFEPRGATTKSPHPKPELELHGVSVISSPKINTIPIPWNEDQSAEIFLDDDKPRKDSGQTWNCVNANSGGDAGVAIDIQPCDIHRIDKFEFDFKPDNNAKVNLYLTFAEDPITRYFINLTGPDYDAPNIVKLDAKLNIKPNAWNRIELDPKQIMLNSVPWNKNKILSSIMIGMLHEGYQNAGLDANPKNASYKLANINIKANYPNTFTFRWNTPKDGKVPQYSYWFDDNPKHDTPPEKQTAGTAETTTTKQTGKYFHLMAKTEEDKWEHALSFQVPEPTPVQQLQMTILDPKPAETWGGNPIVLKFDQNTGVIPILDTVDFKIGDQSITANPLNSIFYPEKRTLTILPKFNEVKPDTPLKASIQFTDSRGNKIVKDWILTFNPKLDKTPPDAPIIKDFHSVLAGKAYPWNNEVGPSSSRSKVNINITPRTNVLPMATVTNTICGTDGGINLKLPGFSASKHPFLAFDYNIPNPETYVDLLISSSQRRAYMGITDKEQRNRFIYLGDIPDIVPDGTWRTALVDFRPHINEMAEDFPRQAWNITGIEIGNWNYSGSQPGSQFKVSNVRIANIATTLNAPLNITWSTVDPAGTDAFSFVCDNNPDTIPDETPNLDSPKATLENLPQGLNYFHVRARDKNGNWGPAAHAMICIDNSIPKIIATYPENNAKDAAREIKITFNEDSGFMDFTGTMLTVNDKSRSLNNSNTTFDPKTKTLTWSLVSDSNLTGGVLKDGMAFNARINGIKNAAGQEAKPIEWSWTLDYSKDKTPPRQPNLGELDYASFRHVQHFSNPEGRYWSNRYYTETAIVMDEQSKSYCIELKRDEDDKKRYFSYLTTSPFDPNQYPYIRFKYKISPGTKANFYLYVNKEWRAVVLTGDKTSHQVLHTIEEAKDDNTWRTAFLDVKQLVAKVAPDAPNTRISYTGFGELGAMAPANSIRIDDYALVPVMPPIQLLYLSSTDESGISAFNVKLDQNDTLDNLKPLPKIFFRRRFAFKALDKPGLWFFAAQAVDGPGHLSEAVAFPFYCDQPASADGQPDGLELAPNAAPWKHTPENLKQKRTLCIPRVAKTDGDNTLLSFQFLGYRTPNTIIYRPCGNQQPPAEITADFLVTTDEDWTIKYVTLDSANNTIAQSKPVKIKPNGQWSRKLKFTLENKPNQPKTPVSFGFILNPPDRSKAHVIIDNIR